MVTAPSRRAGVVVGNSSALRSPQWPWRPARLRTKALEGGDARNTSQSLGSTVRQSKGAGGATATQSAHLPALDLYSGDSGAGAAPWRHPPRRAVYPGVTTREALRIHCAYTAHALRVSGRNGSHCVAYNSVTQPAAGLADIGRQHPTQSQSPSTSRADESRALSSAHCTCRQDAGRQRDSTGSHTESHSA